MNEYGFFVQDDWRVTPKFTLNLGLRYDLQDLAEPTVNNPSAALAALGLNTTTPIRDRNNFGPRFGFSYAFDEKTVLRGGYGIFFGRTPAIMLGTVAFAKRNSGDGCEFDVHDYSSESLPDLSEHLQRAAVGWRREPESLPVCHAIMRSLTCSRDVSASSASCSRTRVCQSVISTSAACTSVARATSISARRCRLQ